jgi:chaperonin GroES
MADRVLVYPNEKEDKTDGGIILPERAIEKPRMGVVMLTGPGKVAELTGSRIPMNVVKGDYILYTVHSGADVDVAGYDRKLRLMTEPEIIGVIGKQPPKEER